MIPTLVGATETVVAVGQGPRCVRYDDSRRRSFGLVALLPDQRLAPATHLPRAPGEDSDGLRAECNQCVASADAAVEAAIVARGVLSPSWTPPVVIDRRVGVCGTNRSTRRVPGGNPIPVPAAPPNLSWSPTTTRRATGDGESDRKCATAS